MNSVVISLICVDFLADESASFQVDPIVVIPEMQTPALPASSGRKKKRGRPSTVPSKPSPAATAKLPLPTMQKPATIPPVIATPAPANLPETKGAAPPAAAKTGGVKAEKAAAATAALKAETKAGVLKAEKRIKSESSSVKREKLTKAEKTETGAGKKASAAEGDAVTPADDVATVASDAAPIATGNPENLVGIVTLPNMMNLAGVSGGNCNGFYLVPLPLQSLPMMSFGGMMPMQMQMQMFPQMNAFNMMGMATPPVAGFQMPPVRHILDSLLIVCTS